MNTKNRDNVFWHKIYVMKYKNPGFKVDKLDWKQAYFKKEKQLKRR